MLGKCKTMSFKLPKNELGIPLLGLGLGTFHYRPEEAAVNQKVIEIFDSAIASGLTHIDSAEYYENDAEVKIILMNALSNGKAKRSDIFITDKYFCGTGSYLTRSSYKNPYDRIKKLLEYLDTPYIDLYLLHAPFIKKETHGFDLKEAWGFVQQAYDEGLVKKIGVSNFSVADIEEIWDNTKTNPQVNQIEFHAFLQEQTPGIVEFCQSRGITVQAYSPLAPLNSGVDFTTGPALQFNELLDKLAAKYGKTKTQVLLRWVIQRGIVPISTTSKIERLEELKGVFDWELQSSEVDGVTKLGSKSRIRKYWRTEYGHYD